MKIGEVRGSVVKLHGMAGTRFYGVWSAMLSRCRNKKARSYTRYGGRGIKVSPAWRDFRNFKRDMFSNYRRGLTIERIDNDGDYSKKNCRWATRTAQIRNRHMKCENFVDQIRREYRDGKTQTRIASDLGISQSSVSLITRNKTKYVQDYLPR
jgi:hypothetical protein